MWTVSREEGKTYITIDTPVETRYTVVDRPADLSRLKAVMMDMDGSSTDTESVVLESIREMMAYATGNPDFRFKTEDYPNIIGDSTTNHVRYLVGEYGLDGNGLDELISVYYDSYHKLLYEVRDGHREAGLEELIKPMPYLREFLLGLKGRGLKVGLVTSSLYEEMEIVMRHVFETLGMGVDFTDFYDGVISAEAAGEPFLKPHPNLYVLMQGMLDVGPEEAFVIEDSTAGIAAGRIAGHAVVAVPHRDTRSHDFSLANLGVAYGGLREIEEKILVKHGAL